MSVRQLSVVGALSAAALLAGAVTMPGAAMATPRVNKSGGSPK